ncbi:MAG TPA: TlpA family protein disulfide reductase, partial [Cyclobacteriaceae bacterium]
MKILINFLIVLLIFVSTLIAIVLPSILIDSVGLPQGVGLIFIFGLAYLLTAGYSKAFNKRFSSNTVAVTIAVTFLLLVVLNLLNSTIKYTFKISPLYITWILGFVGGIMHNRHGFKVKKVVLLALFPIVMAFNLYDLWIHKIEYGNFTGAVASPEVIPFEFVNKEKEIISNEDLKGKVIWLDFWFVGCPPCWKIFPEVQRVYDENKGNPSFALYAVNRFDDPEKLFTKIEEKGYTFPV